MFKKENYKKEVEEVFYDFLGNIKDALKKRSTEVDFWDGTKFWNLLETIYKDWVEQWKRITTRWDFNF